MLKVAIICVSYRSTHATEMFVSSCIGSALLASTDISIYIVNNSNDLSDICRLSQLANLSSNVTVLQTEDNLGYFGGINYVFSRLGLSLRSDFDYVIISNDDLVLTPSFFGELSKMEDYKKSYSVLCPQIISSDGRHENPHVIKPPSFLRELLYSIYYSSFLAASILTRIQRFLGENTRRVKLNQNRIYRDPFPIYSGYGALYILSKRFFCSNTLLSYPSFLMFEEFFLSEQIAQHGELCLFVPQISAFHLGKASTGATPRRQIFQYAQSSFMHYRRLVPLLGPKASLAYKLALTCK